MAELLEVDKLSVAFRAADGGLAEAVHDVSFGVAPGDFIGLVGESGSGKSVTGLAIMNLLPPEITKVDGDIRYAGRSLKSMSEREWTSFRGKEIGMIFQEPMIALDAVFTIGYQVMASARAHGKLTRAEAKERAIEVLRQADITDVESRFDMYPHQLSGGMRQRVSIAMALVSEPRILIADEPTTALDVTTQAQILDTLIRLNEEKGTAVILITHDFGVVSQACHRVVTMYAGEVVEECAVDSLLTSPLHPYSSGLLDSRPSGLAARSLLPSIPGRVPLPGHAPAGCRFSPRCAFATEQCRSQAQELIDLGSRRVRCWRHDEIQLDPPRGVVFADGR